MTGIRAKNGINLQNSKAFGLRFLGRWHQKKLKQKHLYGLYDDSIEH